jgi:competence protein ComEC
MFEGPFHSAIPPHLALVTAQKKDFGGTGPATVSLMIRRFLPLIAACVGVMFLPSMASAKGLEIYWIDSEGGGSTLLVTPNGESILIDAGNPGPRDAGRIHKVATTIAGIKKIDHLVVTHFHIDHFGGVADLAELMPIENLYDKGLPDAATPPDAGANAKLWAVTSAPYRQAKVGRRITLNPGDSIPLKQGETPLSLTCIAANRSRIAAPSGAHLTPECETPSIAVKSDPTDNAASVVLLLQLGEFRFFDGGDLTMEMEEKLVCPTNIVGTVDLYQVNHHGLDVSNHPKLVKALAPTVSVMNNGPRKGTSSIAMSAIRSSPNLQAMYQVHENVRADKENNAAPEFIANHGDLGEGCAAHFIKCEVSADGARFDIQLPHAKHVKTFKTLPKKP